ncbi:MAG TPA: peptide deformylase [Candidatus Sumerlaeota bacterium]|nr:peptide deformylase [Candidatus Sumerlaeota bacterium]
MPLLPIRIYDDPILRETARPIEQVTDRLRALARDMAETMYEARGIGLAANQIGELERIIVVDVDWASRNGRRALPRNPLTLINPEILDDSVEDDVCSEGCLSIPGVEGDVWRPVRIRYRYTDLEGRTHEDEAEGLRARCIQHEIDHLNGVLFIDRMTPEERARLAGALAQIRRKRSEA